MKMATTLGIIAGSMLGAVGVGYAMSDRRTRNKFMKDSKKMVSKAGSAIEDLAENIW